MAATVSARGVDVHAGGVLTGWGEGVSALPATAAAAAGGRAVVPLDATVVGERFRRATRECRLGVAAVEALLRDGGLARSSIAGPATALTYVTAAAYGAANRQFIAAAAGSAALHFPSTAPSAVPAEVAIEFGLTGPYTILVGGADASIEALAHARRLVTRGACARALVLAVETFAECADLWARGRWLAGRPLVEAAAAVLLVPAEAGGGVDPGAVAVAFVAGARRRAGETLACGPLIALGLARAAHASSLALGSNS